MITKEAMQALLEGKKVTNDKWKEYQYIYLNDYGHIVDEMGRLDDIVSADGYKIYEEPKPKQTVTIEKWLCKYGFNFSDRLIVLEMCSTNNMEGYTKIKLIDTYEVEL